MRRTILFLGFWLAVAGSAFAAEPLTLIGEVRAGDKPLEGAAIELLPWLDERAEAELWLAGKVKPEALAKATSDAFGAFALTAPAPGNYKVLLEAKGRVPLEIAVAGLVEPRDLPLAEPRADDGLLVKVKRPDGSPAAGAWVLLEPSPLPAVSFGGQSPWSPSASRALASERGEARVPLSAAAKGKVRAYLRGHLPLERGNVGPGQTTLELAAVASVIAVVRGADRRPLGGALALVGAQRFPVGSSGADGKIELPARLAANERLAIWGPKGEFLHAAVPAAPEPSAALPTLDLRRSLQLVGRVLTRDGRRPLGGAVVWSLWRGSRWSVTDGGGRYQLDLPETSSPAVGAQAVGFRAATWTAFQEALAGEPGPTLLLESAARLAGVVVDGTGQPVRGARVEVLVRPVARSQMMMGFPGNESQPVWVRTHADGSFRLTGLGVGRPGDLTVSHRDFAAHRETLPPLEAGPTEARRIVLAPGRTARGIVRDRSERPIAGASVKARIAPPDRLGGALVLMSEAENASAAEIATDAEGRFALAHLGKGRYNLEVTARGFAPQTVAGIELPAGHGGLDLGTVYLDPGAVLEGRVVDPQGKGLAGARLDVDPVDSPGSIRRLIWRDDQPERALSAVDGWFRIEDLRPGAKVMVSATLPGYGGAQQPNVSVPRETPLEIVLTPRASIAGKVVDRDGRPVGDATVWASVRRGFGIIPATGEVRREPTRSDARGEFLLPDVEAGEIEISAFASGYASTGGARTKTEPGIKVEGVEIVLEAEARLVGEVFGSAGEVVAEARVSLGRRSGTGGFGGEVRSDGDGRFVLGGVPPGRHSVEAEHEEWGATSTDVDAKPGSNRLELRFGARSEIGGRVVDSNGLGLAGASVAAQRVGGGFRAQRTATTDAQGLFRLRGLSQGQYEVTASHRGFASAKLPAPVEVGAAPVEGLELRLGAGGTIVGRVTGLPPADLAEVWVMAWSADRQGSVNGRPDYAGRFRLENLAAGPWRLSARKGMMTSGAAEASATVTEGAEVEVELAFGRGVKLSGRVLQGGKPVSGARLYATGKRVTGSGGTTSGPDGRFEIEELPRGVYDLTVQAGTWNAPGESREVDLSAGDQTIEIVLPESGLRGRVLSASGRRPVSGAAVVSEPLVAASPDELVRRRGRVTSDGSGGFELSPLAAGSYRLRIERDGYEAVTREVSVREGEIAEVEIELAETEGITLQVRRSSGGAPSELTVALRGGDGRVALATSVPLDSEGRGRVGTAPRGSYELLAQAEESALTRVAVVSPGGPFSVVLAPGGVLDVDAPALRASEAIVTLRVVDERGRPFERLWGTEVRSEFRMSRGTTRLTGLAPGRWEVSAVAPDGTALSGAATVIAGGLAKVTLE